MSTFLTADTHFSHARIIELAKRPFKDVDEMNNALIHNWNAVVRSSTDVIYHLGDFNMGGKQSSSFRHQLNGKIHLIVGNHDKRALMEPHLWESISPLADVHIEGQRVVLCHYAMKVWHKSHQGSFHCYGHSHGSLPDDPNSLSCDVGVDCWNYFPVSFAQIKKKMASKTFKPIDHHDRTTN